ncbi:MAG: hypothetical protein ABIU96_03925 [Rhodanobacter sp.]
MASRRNSAVKIYVNGKTANDLYGLSRRIGQQVSRVSVASQRAQASLARKLQPVAKREIRNVYGVKAGMLNDRMRLDSGTRKNSDYISLWASTRKLPLIVFGGTWRGVKSPGAVASILLGSSKTYAHAFIATVGWRGASGGAIKDGTSNRNIYVRSMGPDGQLVGRGPLRQLKGPSVFEMIATTSSGHDSKTVAAVIVPQLQEFYTVELARQMALELRRA